ncbi:MAG TPA: hypothetical protein VJR05_13595 [Acidimicrobiia bacterium]|nr:hypothetical protein [Acidimicrobiia bacterium]
MTWHPDDFEDLAAELRRRVGAEFTEEAAELERLTEIQRRRRSSLADAARSAMHRGDRVSLGCGERRWSGQLVSVADDYVVLESGDSVVEADLAWVSLELLAARAGGRSGRPPSATWRARLLELEQNREEVEIYAPSMGLTMTGRVVLVATDYVEIAERDRRVLLPLASLAAVIRQR